MENEKSLLEEPKSKKKTNKFLLVLLAILPIIIILAIYGYNFLTLQIPMNSVIEKDSRNSGIDVSVQYDSYINISVMKYDLTSFLSKAPVDIFRVFLQYAEAMQNKTFDYVILSCRGEPKFKIRGDYFKKLGSEYSSQNAAYTIRTFPENVINLDGSSAYGKWEGGLLGVLKNQMEDFNDFIKKWSETE